MSLSQTSENIFWNVQIGTGTEVEGSQCWMTEIQIWWDNLDKSGWSLSEGWCTEGMILFSHRCLTVNVYEMQQHRKQMLTYLSTSWETTVTCSLGRPRFKSKRAFLTFSINAKNEIAGSVSTHRTSPEFCCHRYSRWSQDHLLCQGEWRPSFNYPVFWQKKNLSSVKTNSR